MSRDNGPTPDNVAASSRLLYGNRLIHTCVNDDYSESARWNGILLDALHCVAYRVT